MNSQKLLIINFQTIILVGLCILYLTIVNEKKAYVRIIRSTTKDQYTFWKILVDVQCDNLSKPGKFIPKTHSSHIVRNYAYFFCINFPGILKFYLFVSLKKKFSAIEIQSIRNRISNISNREKTLKPTNMPSEPPRADKRLTGVIWGDSLTYVYIVEE